MPEMSVTSSDILNGLDAKIEPVKKSITYFIGLFTSSFFVILLPILYLLTIVATALGIFFHATQNAYILSEISGRGSLIACSLIYFGPILAGAAMVFFMTKPLFAQKEESVEPVELTREEEPTFFAFIDKICAAVNSPVPTKVYLDTEVNASASMMPGFSGFMGGKLVLTVGLPLLRGMNTREVAGILAHEFGHFSQGTGMRLSYVIRSINGWFQRIVFERDQWDERLKNLSQSIDLRIGIFLYLARFMVWLSRKVLWVFMMMSHFVSMYLLRQMEFDADLYEARLAGSAQFPKTAKHMITLGAAYSMAHDATGIAYDEGALPDDFGLLIDHYQDTISDKVMKEVNKLSQDESGTIWDTHPANGRRNKMALKDVAKGVFQIEANNALLFNNIDDISKKCTKHLYSLLLEEKLAEVSLVSTEKTIMKSKVVNRDYDAFSRFFGQTVCFPLPLNIGRMKSLNSETQGDTHAEVLAVKEKITALNKSFDKQYVSLIARMQGTALLKAGFTLKKGQFEIDTPKISEGNEAVRLARHAIGKVAEDIQVVHLSFCKRIKSALGSENLKELNSIVNTIEKLEASTETVCRLIEEFQATRMLVEQDASETESGWNTIINQCSKLHTCLSELHTNIDGITYPFEHTKENITLKEYLFEEKLPKKDDYNSVYRKASVVIDNVTSFYTRTLGHLAFHVEEYENSLGLPEIDLTPAAEQEA